MSRRTRMTATETLAACERLGVYLAHDGCGRLYFWNNRADFEDMESQMSDALFGAVIRNQAALIRMVRYMDDESRADIEAERLSNGQQADLSENAWT